MEKRKGLSLMVLLITVSITLVMVSIITISVAYVQNNSTKVKFATEISYMQELIDSYFKTHNEEYPILNSIIIDISNVSEKARTQFEDEKILDEKITLYEIDKELLGKNETIYGNKNNGADDVYAVSTDTGKVYYVKGIKIADNTYFSLNDELKKIIGYVEKNNAINKDGILFLPSTTLWSNEKVTLQISIPKIYTATVSLTDASGSTSNVNSTSTNDTENIYLIDSVVGNYTVNVRYKKTNDGENLTQNYYIKNFDEQAPILEIDEQKNVSNNESKYAYFKISNVSDELSGIKRLKYEIENIAVQDAVSYFKTNGKNIQNNVIELTEPTEYVTVYAEDNAGNVIVKNIKVNNFGFDAYSYVKDGLIANFDALNNSGNGHNSSTNIWKDLTGNNNDLVATNFNNTSNGWNNNKIIFDGTNYLHGKNPLFNGKDNRCNATIEIVSKKNNTGNGTLISTSLQYNIYSYLDLWSSDQGHVVLYETTNDSPFSASNRIIDSATLPINTINLISYGLNSDKFFSYLNGANKNVSESISDKGWYSNDLYIGRSATDDSYFKGEIYSIRIYNKALTEEEIKHNAKIDKLRFGI